MKFFKAIILVSIIVFAASLAAFIILAPKGTKVSRVYYSGAEGGRIVADYYQPTNHEGKLPAVILCHGVEANKEVMGHLGVEFARRGYAALSFDYGGYGESDRHNDNLDIMIGDTVAAITFMRNTRMIDETRIALVGHSMGVTYSVETAALVPMVRAVMGLGNEAISSGVPPNNVALAMGIYDAFHTLDDMLSVIRESSGIKDQQPDVITGDFTKYSARALFTSPISDHGIEPVDEVLIGKTIRWIDLAFGGNGGDPGKIVEPLRAKMRLLMVLAGVCFILSATVVVAEGGQGRGAIWKTRLFMLPIAGAAIVGNLGNPRLSLICADVTFAMLIGGSIAAALVRRGFWQPDYESAFRKMRQSLFQGVAVAALVIVCLLSGLLIAGIPQAIRLGYLPQVPAFLANILVLRPYEGLCMLRAYGFYRYSEAWIPGVPLAIIMAIEVAAPGAAAEAASFIARILIKAFSLKGPFRLQTSKTGAIGAVLAFVGLGLILYKRFREGWLSSEALHKMMIISLNFMIIPLVIFIVAVNALAYFRNMAHK